MSLCSLPHATAAYHPICQVRDNLTTLPQSPSSREIELTLPEALPVYALLEILRITGISHKYFGDNILRIKPFLVDCIFAIVPYAAAVTYYFNLPGGIHVNGCCSCEGLDGNYGRVSQNGNEIAYHGYLCGLTGVHDPINFSHNTIYIRNYRDCLAIVRQNIDCMFRISYFSALQVPKERMSGKHMGQVNRSRRKRSNSKHARHFTGRVIRISEYGGNRRSRLRATNNPRPGNRYHSEENHGKGEMKYTHSIAPHRSNAPYTRG